MPFPSPVMIMYQPRKIKSHDPVQTTNVSQCDQEECLNTGMNEHTSKPKAVTTLIIKVKAWILGRREKITV